MFSDCVEANPPVIGPHRVSRPRSVAAIICPWKTCKAMPLDRRTFLQTRTEYVTGLALERSITHEILGLKEFEVHLVAAPMEGTGAVLSGITFAGSHVLNQDISGGIS